MSKPTDDFWDYFGIATIILAILGGFALLAWASGGK